MNDSKDGLGYCEHCDTYGVLPKGSCVGCRPHLRGQQMNERDQKIADEEESPLYTSKTPKAPTPTEFLADVPKLEDLPRACYEEFEVHVLCNLANGTSLIRGCDQDTTYISVDACDTSDLTPLPQTVPWDAKRFHEWFAEYGMDDVWVAKGKETWKLVTSIWSDRIGYFDGQRNHPLGEGMLLHHITHIRHTPDGEEVACVMEVKK